MYMFLYMSMHLFMFMFMFMFMIMYVYVYTTHASMRVFLSTHLNHPPMQDFRLIRVPFRFRLVNESSAQLRRAMADKEAGSVGSLQPPWG